MSRPTFYIPPTFISDGNAVLTGEELHHARLTLRLGPGDEVRVVDGEGTSWDAVVRSMGREEGALVLSDKTVEQIPALDLTIAMGVVQGERFDWAVQKGTELGASAFVPLITERTEGRFRGKWKRLERLERVIIAACKQCGRARFPALSQPVKLPDLDISSCDLALMFWEGGDVRSLKDQAGDLKAPGSCIMVIGPAGGLTADEVAIFREKGGIAVGMGSRILRTETAVTAGAALLQFLWGDMG